jgi:hypothetical protein
MSYQLILAIEKKYKNSLMAKTDEILLLNGEKL